MKLNYNEMRDYQKYWEECDSLTQKQKQGLIELSNELIKRAKENGGELDEITLLYPEDFSGSYRVFSEFADCMNARATIRKEGGAKISGWGYYHEVEVE